MKQIKIVFILLILVLLFLVLFSINFYFLKRLNDQQQHHPKQSDSSLATGHRNAKKITRSHGGSTNNNSNQNKLAGKMLNNFVDYEILLRENVQKLKPVYRNRNPRYYKCASQILANFVPKKYTSVEEVWKRANQWTNSNEVFPEFDDTIGQVMHAMQTEPIVTARNYHRGTQLKLMFTLGTGAAQQPIVFKPMWYSRKHIVRGPVYAGKDRHTAEIFGFYLSAILDMRSTPIVVGRKISVKELYAVADNDMKLTMSDATNETCYWGKCHYCRKSERVCGNVNKKFEVEGVLIYLVPGKFQRERSPWQRTYKDNVKAEWEYNSKYCDGLKSILPETRLLDLVDAAIFDFLVQNGDRHHYETRNDALLMLDNGKGFGNPYIDYLDILAPLYQCCILRRKTWSRLLIFSGGSLTEIIRELSKNDILDPILLEDHYDAVERRLLYVFTAIEWCMDNFGRDNILR